MRCVSYPSGEVLVAESSKLSCECPFTISEACGFSHKTLSYEGWHFKWKPLEKRLRNHLHPRARCLRGEVALRCRLHKRPTQITRIKNIRDRAKNEERRKRK